MTILYDLTPFQALATWDMIALPAPDPPPVAACVAGVATSVAMVVAVLMAACVAVASLVAVAVEAVVAAVVAVRSLWPRSSTDGGLVAAVVDWLVLADAAVVLVDLFDDPPQAASASVSSTMAAGKSRFTSEIPWSHEA